MATIKEWNEQYQQRRVDSNSFFGSPPGEIVQASHRLARLRTQENIQLLREIELEYAELTGHVTGHTLDTEDIIALDPESALVLEDPVTTNTFYVFYSGDVWKFILDEDDPTIEETPISFLDPVRLLRHYRPGVILNHTLQCMQNASFTERQESRQESRQREAIRVENDPYSSNTFQARYSARVNELMRERRRVADGDELPVETTAESVDDLF